jgi:hypothetical protein
MPTATYQGFTAYDPAQRRIWLLGGAPPNNTAVQYYDLATDTSGVSTATLPTSAYNYNGNAAVVVGHTIWYALYSQICSFDTVSETASCPAAWTYPSYTYGPALTTDGTDVYVISNYYSTWKFRVADALAGNSPWQTLANQQFYRADYPGAAYYDGYIYAIGGSYDTTAVERLYVGTDPSQPTTWQSFGSLPVHTYLAATVQVGNLLYVISGEQDYNYSSAVILYDLASGNSAFTGSYVNSGRLYFGGVFTGDSIYILNGYLDSFYFTATNSIERLFPLPIPTRLPCMNRQ